MIRRRQKCPVHRNQMLAFLVCAHVCVSVCFGKNLGSGVQEWGQGVLVGGGWRDAEAGTQAIHEGFFLSSLFIKIILNIK